MADLPYSETMRLQQQHRSIRQYTDQPIDTALLHAVIRAGQGAATSSFVQAYSIVRVTFDVRPLVIAVMVAASASFATPIGYQTNMLVYGPGGYRFTDFMRVGIPLNLSVGLLASALIPLMWPL